MIILGAVVVGFILGCGFFVLLEFVMDWMSERKKTSAMRQLEREIRG